MAKDKKRELQAGAAFLEAGRDDPATQEALQRVQARLQAMAGSEWVDAIKQAMEEADGKLAEAGLDSPGMRLSAWEHLARVVEKEPGPLTIREIYEEAMVWCDRERAKAKIRESVVRERGGDWSEPATHKTWENRFGVKERALRIWHKEKGFRMVKVPNKRGLWRVHQDEPAYQAWKKSEQ